MKGDYETVFFFTRMVSNTNYFFRLIYLLVSLYCGKQIQPPRQGIKSRSHKWQAGILTTILSRMTQIWKEFSFIYNEKCLQTLLNNGDYRQVSIFFQTTFINVTHHTLSISKLRKAKTNQQCGTEEACWPETQRSVDRDHSLLFFIFPIFLQCFICLLSLYKNAVHRVKLESVT